MAEFEGYKPTAYLCPAGVWTIGYGSTRWDNGKPVVKGDGPITQDAARRMLRRDLEDAARAVDRLVTVPLTEHQRAALISLIYNIGAGAFERSTLLRHLNAERYVSAAGEFTRWVKARGETLPGLVRRRADEAALFSGRAAS
ncbi:MAG: lysozyme [Mizugakiibacter sp.]|uniref:lysozyme n=1 Tax=Mizugakiibacter sp. TaxID=1972610 RepID=UPI00320E63F5